MWKKFVTDYLSFTKKDRVGVIVLVTLIFIVVLLPRLWPDKKRVLPGAEETAKIRLLAAQLNAKTPAAENDNEPIANNYPAENKHSPEKIETFYFDPNTLNVAGWKRLGIRDRTAATIEKYLSKGGKFRKPEDIGKIYGLFKGDYERLLPWVKIKKEAGFEKKSDERKPAFPANDKPVYAARKTVSPAIIEINTADTTAFIALPGIGSKLAARIINFRNKLGGFYDIQQVGETYALPDSTFTRIKSLLQCNPAVIQRININTADANALKQHPYIRWNLANAIVQYRNQHGNFKSIDDLQLITIITPELFAKMKPYLGVQ